MPAWFMKPANAVVPANGVLPYPPGTSDFCHEIELVVAIGRGGRDIDPAQVEPHHIWGYAAGLDLDAARPATACQTCRRPLGERQSLRPLGALLTHRARCGCADTRGTGRVWLAVNGIERQRADLSELLVARGRTGRHAVEVGDAPARRPDLHRHTRRRGSAATGRCGQRRRRRHRPVLDDRGRRRSMTFQQQHLETSLECNHPQQDRPGHRRGQRHRSRRGPRPVERRLSRRAGGPSRRALAGAGGRGRSARPDSDGRAHRCERPAQRAGAVRHHRAQLWPTGSAVQQRRRERAGGADGRVAAGQMVQRAEYQRDRRVPVRARGLRADATPVAAGRAHHQQRLDLGAHAASLHRALYRQQARGDRPDQGPGAGRPGVQHRRQPDRHRQRTDRIVRTHDARRTAGQRHGCAGTHDGCAATSPMRCATSPRCR